MQRFKNVKIYKEMYGYTLLTIGSIYTKLGDFVKIGLHFMTKVANSVIYGLVPSPSRLEHR